MAWQNEYGRPIDTSVLEDRVVSRGDGLGIREEPRWVVIPENRKAPDEHPEIEQR